MIKSLNATELIPQLEEHQSIVAMATPANRRNSEASLLVLGEGRYLMAYTAFSGSPRDDSDARVVAIRSRDYGLSWSDPESLVVKSGGLNVMSPSLLHLPDGSIGIVYIAKESMWRTTIIWKHSEDEGRTWSTESIIYDGGEYAGVVNDAALLLQSGRILIPLYERLPGKEAWNCETQMRAFCLYSDDLGKNWQRSKGWISYGDAGICEPSVFETTPGHLVMYGRSTVGHLPFCESKDSGMTWSSPIASSFESPNAPSAVRRRENLAQVFLVRNPKWYPDLLSGGPRVPLALSISQDMGTTWEEHRELLESDYSATYSYPSIAFDRHYLLLTYYLTRFRVSLADHPDLNISLCFRRIPFSQLGLATAS